jgi:hypothetical protein
LRNYCAVWCRQNRAMEMTGKAMEDWKKIAEQGRQILAEEEARTEEERIARQNHEKRLKAQTLRSLKPNEYLDDYIKNIRGYFLIRNPIKDMVMNIQSSSLHFENNDEEDESPGIPQQGSCTLDVEIPIIAGPSTEFNPALRFHFSITQAEPKIIEFNRCFSLHYVLDYQYSYPRKYKRFLFSRKGIIETSKVGSTAFSVKDFASSGELIEFLSGQFISVLEEGIEEFKQKSSLGSGLNI